MVLIAALVSLFLDPEDGGSKVLQQADYCLPMNAASVSKALNLYYTVTFHLTVCIITSLPAFRVTPDTATVAAV